MSDMAMKYAMKKRMAKGAKPDCMAEGGEVGEMHAPKEMPKDNHSADMEDADMIARIMHKRKMYSEGGRVANDVGVAEADKDPAEYDDLVLRDDLESSYDGENSGDMDGSKLNQEEGDMISRIMKKRKQTNPRPA